jgi:hypothetical protein
MSGERRKVWFHRFSAAVWAAIGGLAFVFGLQNSVVMVWLASVYANVKSDWGAAEAADNREVLRQLSEIKILIQEINEKLDK